MASLKQKIAAESHVRELLERENVPAPDRIEYGATCIRLLWDGPKVALVVDIDRPNDGATTPDPANPAKQRLAQNRRRNTTN